MTSLPGREWDFDASDSTQENQIPSRRVLIEQRLPQMFPQLSQRRIEKHDATEPSNRSKQGGSFTEWANAAMAFVSC